MKIEEKIRAIAKAKMIEDSVMYDVIEKFNENLENKNLYIVSLYITQYSIYASNNISEIRMDIDSGNHTFTPLCTKKAQEIETAEEFMEMKKDIKKSEELLKKATSWVRECSYHTEEEKESIYEDYLK